MSILSGTVSIEDGVKSKEEYAPARKVRVELTFSVPEGSDGQPFLDTTARLADAKVRELLGRAVLAVGKEPALEVTVQASASGKPVAETAAAKKVRVAAEKAAAAPGKTKDDLAREAGLPTSDTVHKVPEGTLDEETLEPAKPAKKTEAKPDDELNDLLGDSAPAPVSDQELGRACQNKMAELKAAHGEKFSPTTIRSLIEKASGGKRIADIPAAARHAFMKELEALK